MTWVMVANRPAVIDTNGGTVFATSDVPHREPRRHPLHPSGLSVRAVG